MPDEMFKLLDTYQEMFGDTVNIATVTDLPQLLADLQQAIQTGVPITDASDDDSSIL